MWRPNGGKSRACRPIRRVTDSSMGPLSFTDSPMIVLSPTTVLVGFTDLFGQLTPRRSFSIGQGHQDLAAYPNHDPTGWGMVPSMVHGWGLVVCTYCAAEDCSATLVEITDELGNLPFGQLIAFSVLPLSSSHSGSLGGTVLLRGTDRRLADYSFPRRLIHSLQGFAYGNEGRSMSFRLLAKLNSVIYRIPFLFLFSPICSVLRLSVYAYTKTSNT
uniref:Uncharacterized protein n=1 Tax=Solanum tuberosum TaxID=4113 RepID=M1DVL5_SOLTU